MTIKIPAAAKKPKKQKLPVSRLYFVLDNSGSMYSMSAEAISGFNIFVEEQKKVPGEAYLTLTFFDNEVQKIHNSLPLADVPLLTDNEYRVRGMTALYDAIGTAVKLAKDERKKGEKSIISVLTDGGENASKSYNRDTIKTLIAEAQSDGIEVLFIGANIDSHSVAGNMGIAANNVTNFAASGKGVGDAMRSASMGTSLKRGLLSASYGGAAAAAGYDANSSLEDFYFAQSTGLASTIVTPTTAATPTAEAKKPDSTPTSNTPRGKHDSHSR